MTPVVFVLCLISFSFSLDWSPFFIISPIDWISLENIRFHWVLRFSCKYWEATNCAFWMASWVSSGDIPRCHTARIEFPTWGYMRTCIPCPSVASSPSPTWPMRAQNSVGLKLGSLRRKRTMFVSTPITSIAKKGGSKSSRAGGDEETSQQQASQLII